MCGLIHSNSLPDSSFDAKILLQQPLLVLPGGLVLHPAQIFKDHSFHKL